MCYDISDDMVRGGSRTLWRGSRTLEPRPLRVTPKSLADANISRRIFYSHFVYYCTFEPLKINLKNSNLFQVKVL